MIVFNDLRITQDNTYLVVSVEIENSPYYEDMYLERVIIDNQETFKQNGPSATPVFTYEVENPSQTKKRNINLIISAREIGTLENFMFFVYVYAGGTPAPDTPCGYDVNVKMRAVINTYPIFQTMMAYTKNLGTTCEVSREFLDKILQLKGLDASIQTGNYSTAIEYWNKYFRNIKSTNVTINCGCNGAT